MEFFDKLGDTLLNAGKDVTQKAKDVSGIAKLKLDIRSKEDFIKSQYTELGKIYYEKNKGADVPEKEQFERIEEALEEIEKISSVHRGENEDNAHFIKKPHIFTYLHRQLSLRRMHNLCSNKYKFT